jgi:nickel/cobalt exporter
VTLFASQFILPEQILPWLSFVSGLMVVAIGLKLLVSHLHSSHHHHHNKHEHHHHHHDEKLTSPSEETLSSQLVYVHHHHHHTEKLPLSNNPSTSWYNLLALSISGGIVPCPSALVLLLTAVAIQRVAFGLQLVLAFSLGLATVLTGLGLLLVYAKRRFEKLPKQMRVIRALPILSALLISVVGLTITIQALFKIAVL